MTSQTAIHRIIAWLILSFYVHFFIIDNLDYKYTLRMCSISSRVPNGTCMNETIPEVGVRKVCTCSTDMCNAASRNNFLFILLLLMIFYSTIVFMLR